MLALIRRTLAVWDTVVCVKCTLELVSATIDMGVVLVSVIVLSVRKVQLLLNLTLFEELGTCSVQLILKLLDLLRAPLIFFAVLIYQRVKLFVFFIFD